MIVNGKEYPLWSQFIERKTEFIGGKLQEFQNPDEDSNLVGTEITDISLYPNGEDSAYFAVYGKDFGCGFDVQHGGITSGEEGWITFSGYGGHTWRIKQREP
jgi:hypothetical protein